MDDDDLRAVAPADDALFGDVAGMIDSARQRVAAKVNSELVALHWSVGQRVREQVLGGERAEYGRRVVKRLAARLTERYGRGWGQRSIERMVTFAEAYPVLEIASPLATQLTWTNITELLTISDQRKRDFYLAFCAHERWSKRTLRAKVAGKLYERTIAARGSEGGLEAYLATLTTTGTVEPTLAFRDPYVLDFLGLAPEHSEAALERAILDEMQRFLLELGVGFAFVERQKRMTVDGRDYRLDLLLYHIAMRCYVALESGDHRASAHHVGNAVRPIRRGFPGGRGLRVSTLLRDRTHQHRLAAAVRYPRQEKRASRGSRVMRNALDGTVGRNRARRHGVRVVV
jgi:predicted nuclease of restriction endonuclease-like (RecB) superfamily